MRRSKITKSLGYGNYYRPVILIRISVNKFVVYSKTVTGGIPERKMRCTENVVHVKNTIIYLPEHFHFPSHCLSTKSPHYLSLTYHRRRIFIIAIDSVDN